MWIYIKYIHLLQNVSLENKAQKAAGKSSLWFRITADSHSVTKISSSPLLLSWFWLLLIQCNLLLASVPLDTTEPNPKQSFQLQQKDSGRPNSKSNLGPRRTMYYFYGLSMSSYTGSQRTMANILARFPVHVYIYDREKKNKGIHPFCDNT